MMRWMSILRTNPKNLEKNKDLPAGLLMTIGVLMVTGAVVMRGYNLTNSR
jgi:hypothetical protein